MKNITSREELISIIKKKLFNSSNTQFKNQVQEFVIQNGGFELKDYKRLETGKLDLESLKDSELYWFAYAMDTIGSKMEPKVFICRVDDFFTPVEIKNVKFYNREQVNLKDLYIIQNVKQLAPNQFGGCISVAQLAEMKRRKIIRATPELQRESKVIKNSEGTEILRQIEIDIKKAKNIEEKIANDQYHYNLVRLNLINDGLIQFEYNEDEGYIVLPENGDVIIPDGNHRTIGAELAYADYPEKVELFKNRYFEVSFTFYDIDTVKDCISQEWKVTPPNSKHKEAMERNYSNKIVEMIKVDPTAEDIYKKHITTTGLEKGFIVQSILSNCIEKYYQVNSFSLLSEAIEVKDWLVEFFNYLSRLLKEDFKDYKSTRKTRWSTESTTWVGYAYLSKQLQKDSNWKDKLKKFVESVDWNRTASPVKHTNNDDNNVENYFVKKWSELQI